MKIVNRVIMGSAVAVAMLGMSGCSGKQEPEPVASKRIVVEKPKPYEFRLKPQIGTRHDDARTVVDMGEVLKVTLNSYKNRQGNLVASHDVYIWARMPDFIVGEKLPTRKSNGMVNPSGRMPFMLRNEELDQADVENDETIRTYVNQVYKMEQDERAASNRKLEANRYDSEIIEFLKENGSKE